MNQDSLNAYRDLCLRLDRLVHHEVRGLLGGASLQLEVLRLLQGRVDEGQKSAQAIDRAGRDIKQLTRWQGLRERWFAQHVFCDSEANASQSALPPASTVLGEVFLLTEVLAKSVGATCLVQEDSVKAAPSAPTSLAPGMVALLMLDRFVLEPGNDRSGTTLLLETFTPDSSSIGIFASWGTSEAVAGDPPSQETPTLSAEALALAEQREVDGPGSTQVHHHEDDDGLKLWWSLR